MKNQLFLAAEEAVNQRKLDVTLRQFTADRLNKEKRHLIEAAVGCQRQSCIIVCPTEQQFRQAVAVQKALPRRAAIQMLVGSLKTLPAHPAAALVYRYRPQGMSSTVYLYIP